MLKRIFLIGLFVLCTATLAYGAVNTFTQSIDARNTVRGAYSWTGHPAKDAAWIWAKEVEDRLDGSTANQSFYFGPTTTAPTATEGRLYYNNTTNALTLYTGSAWATLEAGGDFASLDEGYNGGAGVTVDNGAVVLTAPNTADNTALQVIQSDTGTSILLNLDNAGTGASIDIDGQSSANDIEGTGDTWGVTSAGIGSFVGLITGATDIVMENGEILKNATNDVILIDTGDEDLSLDFTTGANTITLGSNSTGGTILDFGDFVTLSQMRAITFEPAAAGTITLNGTTNAWDLTIAQSGTVDSSLILSSAGSVTDALSLLTTDALGVIKISSSDTIDIDAADTIYVDNSGGDMILACAAGSFTLNAEEAVDNAIDIDSAAGGFDMDIALSIAIATTESETDSINIDSAGGIDIDISGGGATEDFSVTTDTSVTMTATENAQSAIHLEENGGTSGSINLYSNLGSGASATTEHDASIQLQSDAGGISLYTTGDVADAVRIETNGGVDENISIVNLQGTGADAITITATAAGGDLNLDSKAGRIEIEAEEDVASAVLITADGGNSTTMLLHADTGTSVTEKAAAISIVADDGGVNLYSGANLDDAIVIQTDGGTTAEMLIWADQGNTATSIELLSDAGGITLTAAKPVTITHAFELDVVVHPTTTPITLGVADSGQVHFLPDTAQDTTLNLPAEADGLHYKFIYAGNATDAHDFIFTSGSDGTNYFIGGVVQHDEDGELTVTYYPDGNSNDTLTIYTPQAGTELEFWCTGVNWYVTGTIISATNTGAAFAD